ncbi:MAG TPA: ComF family protein [Bacilli bacterium]|nr:ComF family protein [Bacilli bacterium]
MDNYCLYCDERLQFRFNWQTLWQQNHTLLCATCSNELEPIVGDICISCGRSFDEESEPFRSGDQCYDCIRWESNPEWQGLLVKNRSLFRYNDFMKELIARFKYRGDTILATVFQERLRQMYQKEFSQKAYIVPIPLSKERLLERGFNQAEILAQMLGKPIPFLLAQHRTEKQSKKNRSKRLNVGKSIFYLENRLQSQLIHADIIIIDDIYTTGTTIRQAAKLLLLHGARTVSSLTIAR